MDPLPIERTEINLVLSYIQPLTAALPPHLISRPLLQRHRFLSLTAQDPVEYLSWPSHNGAKAVRLLEDVQQPPHDLLPQVQYSADSEYLQAHVRITATEDPASAFRLIFQWDPTHGWQYHNIALMPFPSNSSDFPDALRIFRPSPDFLNEPSYVVSIANDDNDDSYWNSYGQEDDIDPLSKANTIKAQAPLNSEDAYWAQYSSIQGSADSTVPSPLPQKRGLPHPISGEEQRVFVPTASLQPHTELYNPLEPPSPDSLAKRLADLSDRLPSPPLEEDQSSADSETTSSLREPSEIDILEPISDYSPSPSASQFVVVSDEPKNLSRTDGAMLQTVQGLYQLWKIDQQYKAAHADKDAFISMVRRALDM